MIKSSLVNGEMVIEGEVVLDEVYTGVCCAGHGWLIAHISPDRDPGYVSVWGACQNPECDDSDPEDSQWRGVFQVLVEDLAEMMLDGKVTHEAAIF